MLHICPEAIKALDPNAEVLWPILLKKAGLHLKANGEVIENDGRRAAIVRSFAVPSLGQRLTRATTELERARIWWRESVACSEASVEVSKAIWRGTEHNPNTEAGFRSICISAQLYSQLQEYLAGRTEGYLFHTSSGNPWDASNVLERKLNALLERLEIPKIDPKLLAKIVGKDRIIEQATRSEKRAASLGLHSLRHTNATAMDSLSIPQQIRKQRLPRRPKELVFHT